MRRMKCRFGWHETFIQEDKWGLALLCKHCDVVLAEFKAE